MDGYPLQLQRTILIWNTILLEVTSNLYRDRKNKSRCLLDALNAILQGWRDEGLVYRCESLCCPSRSFSRYRGFHLRNSVHSTSPVFYFLIFVNGKTTAE